MCTSFSYSKTIHKIRITIVSISVDAYSRGAKDFRGRDVSMLSTSQ